MIPLVRSDSPMATEESGERQMQIEMDSSDRAERFYKHQLARSLNPKMIELIQRQEMVFVATADAGGNCDCSPRFGEPGFVHVVDTTTLAYPEYRGNGVYASLGNILENPHIGLVFLDFFQTTVGLHVNGKADSYSSHELPKTLAADLLHIGSRQRILERWVIVTVDEAYIHCSKHVPLLKNQSKAIEWGTDDPQVKSSDYFTEASDLGRDTSATSES